MVKVVEVLRVCGKCGRERWHDCHFKEYGYIHEFVPVGTTTVCEAGKRFNTLMDCEDWQLCSFLGDEKLNKKRG